MFEWRTRKRPSSAAKDSIRVRAKRAQSITPFYATCFRARALKPEPLCEIAVEQEDDAASGEAGDRATERRTTVRRLGSPSADGDTVSGREGMTAL